MEILKDTNDIDKDAIKRITNLVQSLKRFVRLDEMTSQAANINEELDLTLNLLRHKLKKRYKACEKLWRHSACRVLSEYAESGIFKYFNECDSKH